MLGERQGITGVSGVRGPHSFMARSGRMRRFCGVFVAATLRIVAIVSVCSAQIVIYGDSQHNPEAQRAIVRQILLRKPAVVFRVGDLVDDGRNPALWEAFEDIHGPLLETTQYFPALGNHEYNSPLYFRQFPHIRNRRWYSLDREGIHFVVLDSNAPLGRESKQYAWLVKDLVAAKADFIVFLFHHPLFDVSARHAADEKALKPVLMPLIQQYGVSAVFCGHSHDYQRFDYEGIPFIVTGGGGSRLYEQRRTNPYLQAFAAAYHFCLLAPQDGFVSVSVIDSDGRTIDDFRILARSESRNATLR